MEEDDVTIREQNFHSQVREYIVSNVTERLIRGTLQHTDRVCALCSSLQLASSLIYVYFLNWKYEWVCYNWQVSLLFLSRNRSVYEWGSLG